MFGRATITLGIGPHSSLVELLSDHTHTGPTALPGPISGQLITYEQRGYKLLAFDETF